LSNDYVAATGDREALAHVLVEREGDEERTRDDGRTTTDDVAP
jgi:hypothetical protein